MNYSKLAVMIEEAGIAVPVLTEFLKRDPARAKTLYDDCCTMLHEKLECRLREICDDEVNH